jgi:hypothetical protein
MKNHFAQWLTWTSTPGGTEVVAVNLGKTRADGELSLKIRPDAGETLERDARGVSAR